MMGSGKTSAAINYINSSPEDVRFLYITPYLTEVSRIISKCSSKNFKEPKELGSKLNGIRYLFERGENVVSTHKLFSMFDDEIIDLAYNNNYVLIMDEVANVVDALSISDFDLNTIRKEYTYVDDNNLLRWDVKDYTGKLENYKQMCDLGCVGVYKENALLWLFPISTFKAFHKIFILTYLFEAQMQKSYFDYYGVQYTYGGVEKDEYGNCYFTSISNLTINTNIKKSIHILDNSKLNEIGDFDTALSSSWYSRHSNKLLMSKLKKNCYNYFRHYTQTKSKLNMWTSFVNYQSELTGKGYAKGFVPLNMRASNDFRQKTSLAYLANRFLNPYIKNFFLTNGININEDLFALSEMIQWIWRSAIRDGHEIWIYIPSSRMRNLLINWLNSLEHEGIN